MKIGIDISQIVYGTGVSQYTKNLVQALLKEDQGNKYFLFGGALRRFNDLNHFSKSLKGNFLKKFYLLSPTLLDFFWNRLHFFSIENFVGEVDIFHSSDWAQPPRRKAKLVTTIHDLVPLLFPESSHPKIVGAHKRRLEWVKKEVDRVIAVSQSTKNDIITYLGIPNEKILVIYEAPDPIFKKIEEARVGEIRRKYNLPKEYFLVVGTDLRKNLERIAKAIELIPGSPGLVVVGKGWENPNLTSHNILWLGHLPVEDLVGFYNAAQALVYVSLYEGFGLPILEAMSCGCPVVTSNVSSMPEIAGEAAILVNPKEVDEIKHGIERALNKREELIKKGFARVKNFSWEKAARETLAVYKEVAALKKC